MAKNKKNFQVGDSVKVKNGVKDHKFGIDVGGWQGQISKIDNDIICIEWDSVTLSTFPDEYISHCEKEGLDWEKIYLETEEVEPVIRHNTDNVLVQKLQEIKSKHHSNYFEDSGESISEVHEFARNNGTSNISQFLKETNQTTKTIGKWAAGLGIIGLVVGISASYNYLMVPEKGMVTGITPRDSQSTANATIEIDPLVSSATSADSKKLNNQEGAIEQTSPSPMSSSANLESKFELTFWASIKDNRSAEYQAYLEAFPNGHFAAEARLQLAKLKWAKQTPPALPQPSGVDAKTTIKGEVVRLLKLAASHFKADRLMAPKYDNALYVYLKILRLDEENPDAQAGIKRIKTKLMSYASVAQTQNDMETARNQLKKILVIDPQDDKARAALEKLQ